MHKQALAIANNDIVYLWWTYPKKIPQCLGFTIRRMQKGKAPVALFAFVGFKTLAEGEGYNKKMAEQAAAMKALNKLKATD